MYICYIDESGTPEIPGTSSHFILAGIAVPINEWRDCDQAISQILKPYDLEDAELHTAWIARKYLEQTKIPNFDNLSYFDRRSKVQRLRTKELLRLQKAGNPKHLRQTKKNYGKTEAYIHLTYLERRKILEKVAEKIKYWGRVRLFAECIDKTYFDPARAQETAGEQAFEQVISRFQQYLSIAVDGGANSGDPLGMIVHDNNESVAKKHTQLMRKYFDSGTLWTDVNNIIETPLFVDSSLTRMIQVADLCAYALRRYLENNESALFDCVFERADRKPNGKTVGVRHFSESTCKCKICSSH